MDEDNSDGRSEGHISDFESNSSQIEGNARESQENDEEEKKNNDPIDRNWRSLLDVTLQSETWKCRHIQFWGCHLGAFEEDGGHNGWVRRRRDNLLLKMRKANLPKTELDIYKEGLEIVKRDNYKNHLDLSVLKELLKKNGESRLLDKMESEKRQPSRNKFCTSLSGEMELIPLGREKKYKVDTYRQFPVENGFHPFGSEYLFMTHSQVIMGTIQKHVAETNLKWYKSFCLSMNLGDIWVPETYDRLAAAVSYNYKAEDLKEIKVESKTHVKCCLRSVREIMTNIVRTPRIV